MDMLESIRRIGIFMIAAQTVMHFAAGKQYEKYMKIIAGVIVLLLFISPFVSSSDDIIAKWQEEAEKMGEQSAYINSMWQSEEYSESYVETVALKQIEREVKLRLNEKTADRECYVGDVSIELEETGNNISFGAEADDYGWEFQCVRVTLCKHIAGEDENAEDETQDNDTAKNIQSIESIEIEEIEIEEAKALDTQCEETKEQAYDIDIEEYRSLFAQTLGISEDRVEVSYYGE